jgi:hypothetical protein
MTPKGQVMFSDAFCTLGKAIGKKDTTVVIWGVDKYKTEVIIEEEEGDEEEEDRGGVSRWSALRYSFFNTREISFCIVIQTTPCVAGSV